MRRDIIYLNCQIEHQWVCIGGRNAGCSDICDCSVPVHKCSICGDYDYGENAEAEDVIKKCDRAAERVTA